MVERFASAPSPMTAILLEHFHGAVTRVGVTDTAVPHRAEGWNLLIPSVWLDPAATDENIAWTRETHRAFGPHLDEARWLNYLGDDEGADAVQSAYGPELPTACSTSSGATTPRTSSTTTTTSTRAELQVSPSWWSRSR